VLPDRHVLLWMLAQSQCQYLNSTIFKIRHEVPRHSFWGNDAIDLVLFIFAMFCEMQNTNMEVLGKNFLGFVRFEVFTPVTMKNDGLWEVTHCGSCKNRCVEGTYHLHHHDEKNQTAKENVSHN
jgi:hypothetical protein